MNDFREADWKVLRELKMVALERLCQRIVQEVERELGSNGKSHYDRFLRAHSLLMKGNDKVARAFDDMRRSTAFMHLYEMRSQKLVTDDELLRFSPAVQDKIRALEKYPKGQQATK